MTPATSTLPPPAPSGPKPVRSARQTRAELLAARAPTPQRLVRLGKP